MRILGRAACVLLGTASSLGAVGLPLPRPQDDFLIASQNTPLRIRHVELLANDELPGPLTRYKIFVVSEPQHGRLEREAESLRYVPEKTFFGRETFQYIVVDGPDQSPPATVTIEVAPDFVAVRGDFNGDRRRDWGWFESATAQFHVCYDYPGPQPRCSILWIAPHNLTGRTPIVGDWNADGVDDVGLFDARTGWFHLATPGMPIPRSFPLGRGHGTETPVVGDWNGDRFDTVGLFRPVESRFLLRNQNAPGAFDFDFVFGAELLLRDRHAMAVRWPGAGGDRVALHSSFSLRLHDPATGSRETFTVACESRWWRVPIEFIPGRGLVVYDLKIDRATSCDSVHVPIDVYIPPPDGGGN